jgi:hypothetical protein
MVSVVPGRRTKSTYFGGLTSATKDSSSLSALESFAELPFLRGVIEALFVWEAALLATAPLLAPERPFCLGDCSESTSMAFDLLGYDLFGVDASLRDTLLLDLEDLEVEESVSLDSSTSLGFLACRAWRDTSEGSPCSKLLDLRFIRVAISS